MSPQQTLFEAIPDQKISSNEPEFCAKSTLKQRGWTDTAIERFLGDHDKEVPNPYYKSAAPMKLYKLSRVEEAEQSQAFLHFKAQSKPRQEASQKALTTKRKNLLRKVTEMEIYIQRKNLEDIITDAVKAYNSFKSCMADERGDFDYQQATVNSDKEFLNRITVNYLRHRCSPYEKILDKIEGKVGTKEAYTLLNEKIFQKIGETFPELKAECDRQLEEKIMGLNQEEIQCMNQ